MNNDFIKHALIFFLSNIKFKKIYYILDIRLKSCAHAAHKIDMAQDCLGMFA